MTEPVDRKIMTSAFNHQEHRNLDLLGKLPAPVQSPAVRSADGSVGSAAMAIGGHSVDPPVKVILQRLIRGAWRRRFLIVVPILAMIPLSISAALLMPKTYVARTLLLLQEKQGGNPLARVSEPEPGQIKERIGGLAALLKSDQVLSKVVGDIGLGDARPGSREFTIKIEELRRALNLELIGTDFLEIHLNGSKSQGLGRQLEAVTTRFIEALTASQDLMSAGQMLVERRRQEAQAAEKALADLKARLPALLPKGLDSSSEQLRSVKLSLEAKSRELAAINAEIAVLLHPPDGGAANIDQPPGSTGTSSQAPRHGLNDAEARRDTVRREIDQLIRARDDLERSIDAFIHVQQRIPIVERETSLAQEVYQTYIRRYGNSGPERSLGLLSAPERIKVIDPPKDPEFATKSRLLFVQSGLAAGILLGIGLAWGVELLDQTIREADELTLAAGVPVVAQLPRIAIQRPHRECGSDIEK